MDAAVVAAWAAVIAAVVGPIVAVVLTNKFLRHESHRTEASRVFGRIMENAQNFRYAFLDQHRFRTQMDGNAQQLSQIVHNLEQSASLPPAQAQQVHAQSQALFDYLQTDQHQTQERFDRAFRELNSFQALLNADKLALGLVFRRKSEPCGRKINDLIAMAQLFQGQSPLPPLVRCDERLNELIQAICQEMKLLHDSMIESDPMDTDYGGMV